MTSRLREDVLERVRRDYATSEHDVVAELLAELPEASPRIQHAVLQLADGDVRKLLHYLEVAAMDWRDVIYWAEYPPQPGDPKPPN